MLCRPLVSLSPLCAILHSDTDKPGKTLKSVNAIAENFHSDVARQQSKIARIDGDLSDCVCWIVVPASKAMDALRQISTTLNQAIGEYAGKLTQSATRSLQEFEPLTGM